MKKNSNITIQELQKFISEYSYTLEKKFGKYQDREKLILSSTVKITEELGELCDEVLAFNCRQRKEKLVKNNKDNLSFEFADVIIAVFMLADNMNLNIDQALEKKIKKIKNEISLK